MGTCSHHPAYPWWHHASPVHLWGRVNERVIRKFQPQAQRDQGQLVSGGSSSLLTFLILWLCWASWLCFLTARRADLREGGSFLGSWDHSTAPLSYCCFLIWVHGPPAGWSRQHLLWHSFLWELIRSWIPSMVACVKLLSRWAGCHQQKEAPFHCGLRWGACVHHNAWSWQCWTTGHCHSFRWWWLQTQEAEEGAQTPIQALPLPFVPLCF